MAGETREAADQRDWMQMGLTEVVDHIEQTHHAYVRAELPRLLALLDKIARNHGEQNPRFVELRDVFATFTTEMIEHMAKEERDVFPVCRQLDRGIAPDSGSDAVRAPLGTMIAEHDDGGMLLLRMRELTDDFTAPEGACPTFKGVYESLRRLDRDMRQHVYLENCVLAFKAEQAEARLRKRVGAG